jgi:pyruvate/2-oxoglutarate/acetoin dehydrogenase E1 component
LCEQGIAAFAIGLAAVGWKPIAEIQFAGKTNKLLKQKITSFQHLTKLSTKQQNTVTEVVECLMLVD